MKKILTLVICGSLISGCPEKTKTADTLPNQIGASASSSLAKTQPPNIASQGNGAIVGVTTSSGTEGGVFALPNVTVYLDDYLGFRTVSDNQGRFVLNPVPAGTHYLMAQKVDAKGKRLRARREIKITNGQAQNVTLLVATSSSLNGRIQLADNGPSLKDIDVYLQNSGMITQTARDGQFTLRDVPPGEYDLVVNTRGYKQHIQQNILVNERVQSLPVITLEPHTAVTSQQLYTLSGTVTAGGTLLANSMIQIPGLPFLTLTDASGQFHLPNMPPAQYQVVAVRSGFLSVERTVKLDSDRLGEFILSDDPKALPGEVSVTVTSPEGALLDNVEIHLFPGEYVARTDSDGQIRFLRVHPGDYLVRASRQEFEDTEVPAFLESASQINISAMMPRAIATPTPLPTSSPEETNNPQSENTLTILSIDISTDKDSITTSNNKVAVDRSFQLYAFLGIRLAGQKIVDKSGKNVTWISNSPDIAEVDVNGKITGKSPGKVTILAQAKADSSKTASIDVIVE